MFGKDALQELIKSGHVPEFLKALENTNTQSQLVLVPDSYDLRDLEKYQEFRNNLRGSFDTNLISELTSYTKDHAVDGSKTFVDADEMKATTIFDIGTNDKAGHQVHRARCALKKTAPFKALLDLDGTRKDQRDLAEFLEDWAEYFQAFSSAGEKLEFHKAIAAIRDLDYEHVRGSNKQVSDFSQAQSEYERMATKTKDDLVLPAAFVFTCEPYHGLKARNFELRLSIVRNEVLVLRIKRLEEAEEKMALEFLDTVKSSFASAEVEMPIYIGNF
ncbi:DUF2303 family protein [Vibrio alginolyticus]|uniref:DUF2303 family protein n=1 Tax=Vibrio alginolyticus TaxID=663 RepID=UPI002FF3F8E3